MKPDILFLARNSRCFQIRNTIHLYPVIEVVVHGKVGKRIDSACGLILVHSLNAFADSFCLCVETAHSLASGGTTWLDGMRFSGNASKLDVTKWIDSLNLDIKEDDNVD